MTIKRWTSLCWIVVLYGGWFVAVRQTTFVFCHRFLTGAVVFQVWFQPTWSWCYVLHIFPPVALFLLASTRLRIECLVSLEVWKARQWAINLVADIYIIDQVLLCEESPVFFLFYESAGLAPYKCRNTCHERTWGQKPFLSPSTAALVPKTLLCACLTSFKSHTCVACLVSRSQRRCTRLVECCFASSSFMQRTEMRELSDLTGALS